ncbi:hypothetical protein, partial [Ralstonia solanacearum]|uniref:hypothetical protein n=1 Tax=Ralstonia solanacearum TaxID=305 RepID=UPI001F2A74BC
EASLPQSEKPRWHDSRFHSPTSLISGSLEQLSELLPSLLALQIHVTNPSLYFPKNYGGIHA